MIVKNLTGMSFEIKNTSFDKDIFIKLPSGQDFYICSFLNEDASTDCIYAAPIDMDRYIDKMTIKEELKNYK